MGGVARVVTRGPEAIRGPANLYYLFFLYLHFSSGTFLGSRGAFSASSYTRDKQLFQLNIFLIIYRRAFSSKSILLGPVTSA